MFKNLKYNVSLIRTRIIKRYLFSFLKKDELFGIFRLFKNIILYSLLLFLEKEYIILSDTQTLSYIHDRWIRDTPRTCDPLYRFTRINTIRIT